MKASAGTLVKSGKVQLIQAHPDLVGHAALAGTLTPESNREQTSAGVEPPQCGGNRGVSNKQSGHRGKFGFPFVICARLNKKEAILKGFEMRLKNTREQEIQTALAEIGKIARLRLQDLLLGVQNASFSLIAAALLCYS